ncbi:unnamed protein product [Cylicocyclus nassatus]|uniref:Uncharacterized protein n=1 Tax=Cylicocyclus nassatus TaxID=53992 RepID=A0AA36HEX6_CYLNA|nr:unnamed protein product [Cylicocyclus nassatus]
MIYKELYKEHLHIHGHACYASLNRIIFRRIICSHYAVLKANFRPVSTAMHSTYFIRVRQKKPKGRMQDQGHYAVLEAIFHPVSVALRLTSFTRVRAYLTRFGE